MSQPDVEPLDPGLRALFDAERRRAGAPEGAQERVLRRLEETLGNGSDDSGDPEGGANSGGPIGPGPSGLAGSGLGGALGGIVLAIAASLGGRGDIGAEASKPVSTIREAARPGAPSLPPAGAVLRESPKEPAPRKSSPRPYTAPPHAVAPSHTHSPSLDVLRMTSSSTGKATEKGGAGALALARSIDRRMVQRRAIAADHPRKGKVRSPIRPVASIDGALEVHRSLSARPQGAPPSRGGSTTEWVPALSFPSFQVKMDGGLSLDPAEGTAFYPDFYAGPSAPGGVLWDQRFWGNDVGGGDDAGGLRVAVDSDGNTVVAGWFSGTVVFGEDIIGEKHSLTSKGATDIFVVKFGPDGNLLWSKRFGDENREAALGVAVNCDDDIFVTGWFANTLDLKEEGASGPPPLVSAGAAGFLAKLDPDGHHLWSRRLGGGAAAGLSVAGEDCNAVVTGWFTGIADFGGRPLMSAAGADAFVVNIDTDGNHRWSRRLGGAGQDIGLSVAVDTTGRPIVTGWFSDAIDLGGGSLKGGPAIFLTGLDREGHHRFSEHFQGSSAPLDTHVAVGNKGDVVMAGSFQGQIALGGPPLWAEGLEDIFVAKLDSEGHHRWSRRFGDIGRQSARGVAVDIEGDVVVAGSFQGFIDLGGGRIVGAGGEDAFVVKLDSEGHHLWADRFGGSASECGYGVAVDRDGDVHLSSGVYRAHDAGVGLPSGAHDASVFIAKLPR